MIFQPHDLLWVRAPGALSGELPDWVASQWRSALPLVVRRDSDPQQGRIPVGIRGLKREQRAAAWVDPAQVLRVLAPEALSTPQQLLASPFVSQQPLQAAIQLAQQRWPWIWGITGSAGYALATEVPVMHHQSDLDLLIRCPQPVAEQALRAWQQFVSQLPCRVDTQVETPYGGFALAEWLRDGQVLLKTARGPLLTRQPWGPQP
ncbi:malonate decarboxylase holo-ACP synthase [Erwinia sp. E602]|uniref:malonate decarboxylase holo-ACP synthase n=1 Tax=Erwinia sp. E602 TaxID=2675378 RepID=UPI001BA89116|nr:malonate decarboxylase holo-ACP synthase [Erwinia sp. E602]QUG74318.1 malonate decarboxylase holo-ACP synthase [Erwinia sp. E602]